MRIQAIYRKPASPPHPALVAWQQTYRPKAKAITEALIADLRLFVFGDKKTPYIWFEDAVAIMGITWAGAELVTIIVLTILDNI